MPKAAAIPATTAAAERRSKTRITPLPRRVTDDRLIELVKLMTEDQHLRSLSYLQISFPFISKGSQRARTLECVVKIAA
jgi:hypothetical protein